MKQEGSLKAISKGDGVKPSLARKGPRTSEISLPDGLYGRDHELARIREAYHWTTLGSTQMIGVSGPSGIGKTALIQEATRKIALGQAFLISGKFEPLQQDTPMSPLIAAFRELAEQLLNEDKQRLDQWRDSLMQALGINAAVITEVIPEMERIIGKPVPVEGLPIEESMERFQFVFRRFIQVFCHQKHPLVLVMDDLQWADEASWRMIRSFMTDPQSQSLLLIGAFRDQEHGPIDRIDEELEAIASSGVAVQALPLQPLNPADLTRMVGDTLRVEKGLADDIAHTLFQRSNGNPFLFRRWLLRSLEEDILRYEEQTEQWAWNWEESHSDGDPAHADLLLSYMTDSLNRLPPDTRQALLVASCLGGECPIGLLASWRQESPERTLEVLQPAIRRQFILYLDREPDTTTEAPSEERCLRFVHDRLQEAAHALLDPSVSEKLHWHAGLHWLEHPEQAVRERYVFEAAGHLNKGSGQALLTEDRDRLIQANARAGKKAKAATAFEAAGEYLHAVAALLREEHWERDFEFCFDSIIDLLECEYMNGWTSATDAAFDALLRRARTAYDRTRVQTLAINRMLHTEKLAEGIALGLHCLRDLNVHVSAKPGRAGLLAELLVTKELWRRKAGRLASQQPVTDPVIKIALQVLTMLSGAAFVYNKPLFRALTFKCIRLSLRYGNFPYSAAVLGSFSGILNHALGDRRLAQAALRESLKLAAIYNQPSLLCRAYLTLGVMFFIMEDEHKDFNASFLKSVQYGLEAGDMLFTGHAVVMRCINLHMTGKLDLLDAVLPEYKKMLSHTQNQYMLPYLTILDRWVHALKGREEEAEADGVGEGEGLLNQIRGSGMESLLLFLHGLCLLQEGYLLGEREVARRGAELAGGHTRYANHYVHASQYDLYLGLHLLSQGASLQPSESKKIAACLQRLRQAAAKCPEHVRHKLLLLEAEYARVRGKRDRAERAYDEAIREAKTGGYMHHAAIACECAGQFYSSHASDTRAKGYLIEAYALYRHWGSFRKAEQVRVRYAEHYKELSWDAPEAAKPDVPSAVAMSSDKSAIPAPLDLSIVREAFQSIAVESNQRTLIENLFRTVVAHAGAQRGCFVLEHAKRLVVELAVDQAGNVSRPRIPLERYDEICLPAVRYTANTGDMVLLEHAAGIGRFARDPYVMSCQTKSMLCLPLQFQNQLTAVLYLENNLATGAFAADRLEMLRLLAAQTVFLLKLFPQDDEPTVQAEPPLVVEEPEAAPAEGGSPELMDPLTNRELEVLQLMSLGMSNQEIAHQLHIALGTVKLHTNRIFSKMNVNRRAKAVLEGKRMNLLNDPKP